MIFADLNLVRRLERAEGHACRGFAEARKLLDPESESTWIECAGAWAVFDGVDSPVTQSFGLGIFEEPTPESMDQIEHFFLDRGAPVMHEVCPLAGIATIDLLCARGYRPLEISSVLYQPIVNWSSDRRTEAAGGIKVRVIGAEEAVLWVEGQRARMGTRSSRVSGISRELWGPDRRARAKHTLSRGVGWPAGSGGRAVSR